MPKQASLLGSGVSRDSPLEGHSLRDLASTTPGLARSFLFYFYFDRAWLAQMLEHIVDMDLNKRSSLEPLVAVPLSS